MCTSWQDVHLFFIPIHIFGQSHIFQVNVLYSADTEYCLKKSKDEAEMYVNDAQCLQAVSHSEQHV